MTYGQLKFRLAKAFPGVDADLIEGWITDCYQEILGALPWSRMDVQAILVTTAPYATGTVNVSEGSQAVAVTGGAWSAAMSGRAFRISGDEEEYRFTQTGAATGTLDRAYAGASNAAASYSIYQTIYPLPADCRFLDEGAFPGPRRRLATEQGQETLPSIDLTGEPEVWWPCMDDDSTPPQMQVRLFPIPDRVYGIPYTYCAEVSNPGGTSALLLPWMQPAVLIEGTSAKIKRHLKDYVGAQMAKAAFSDAVAVMRSQESYRRGPLRMEMGSYYTAHRGRRVR